MKLEEQKKTLPAFTPEEGKMAVEDFADNIFGKADAEDRAGTADKNTARSVFLCLTSFVSFHLFVFFFVSSFLLPSSCSLLSLHLPSSSCIA